MSIHNYRDIAHLSTRRQFLRTAAIAGASALLMACGFEPTQRATEIPSVASVPPTASVLATPSAIRIPHLKDELVLDQPATRIISCSDEVVDIVQALEIQPVGICSARIPPEQAKEGDVFAPSAYFYDLSKLGAPVFLGSSLEPSLEQMVTLRPDLIIIISDSDAAYDKMTQIAPVLYLDMNTPGYWRETLVQVGQATGREQQAQQFLARYDQTVAEVRTELAPVVTAKPQAMVVYSFAPGPDMMIFRSKTWLSKGLEQLGFGIAEPPEVAWGPEGWSIVSTELLSTVQPDLLFVLRPVDASGNVPSYPMDALTEKMTTTQVILQPVDPTRSSSAPIADLFVIEQYRALLNTVE